MKIQILGSGCANCHKVEETAKQAIAQMAIDAQVELVTDMQTIMRYGVLQTPGIVIDDNVVSTGRVPALSQMVTLIADSIARQGT
ncbi:MAG: TM0996/MTH895 family glutaredoxin-like protein [Chloroflexi bacterium]|nr:TM0996/MTH895 family glutaredoxin-like protein [Chloroflexota bacterium]